MEEHSYFVKNLKSCFLYTNTAIQLLGSTSLFLLQHKHIVIKDESNYKIIEQVKTSSSDTKNELKLLNHRIFIILSYIKNIFFKPTLISSGIEFSSKKVFKGKPIRDAVVNNYQNSIETFLCSTSLIKIHILFEKKHIDIIEILFEIKKPFLIIDLVGILGFNELLRNYIEDANRLEIQIRNISFHLFRKLRNFKNIKIVEHDFSNKSRICFVFKDKLIKKTNLHEFVLFFLEEYHFLLTYWMNTVKRNLKHFLMWVKNVFSYKHVTNVLLSNFSFLKIDRKVYFVEDEWNLDDIDLTNVSFVKLKISGVKLEYSVENLQLISFLKYSQTISMFFRNSYRKRDKIQSGENHDFKDNLLLPKSENIFHSFGLIYFQQILNGIIELKTYLTSFKKNQISFGVENRVIFSIGLIASKNYSEKILDLFVRKIYKKDFIIFLKTGNSMLYKNLTFLWLSISLNSSKFMKKVIKLKDLKNFYLEIVNQFFFKKYSRRYLFQSNLRWENCFIFKNKFVIIFLVSFSLIQINNLNIFSMKFLTETVRAVKNIDNLTILDREHDFILRFLPLIFGNLVLGIKGELNLLNFKVNFPNNKSLQKICTRMMQYCAFLGTSKKELIKMAIEEIKDFESIKIKKSERIFIIQEKFKKSTIPSNFLSIVDLNVDCELDRSFVYFRSNIEGSILGLCILTFGDKFMSKLIYRIQSFFLSSDSVEYSSFAILATSFLFASSNEISVIDFIIKLVTNNKFITVKNSIFSLGIIGAGTSNTRIKNALKCLANYYKLRSEANFSKKKFTEEDDFQFLRRLKSIMFLIRLSQGMVNSFYQNLSQLNFFTGKINTSTTGHFIFGLFSFIVSNFIGHESIFACFFLFGAALNSTLVCTFNDIFKVNSLRITTQLISNLNKKYILTPCFLLT